MKSKFMRTEEVAKMLGVAEVTVRTWRYSGVGPKYVRLGSGKRARIVYTEAAINEWLERNTFANSTDEKAATGH